jgi:hypothetical protein
VLWIDPTNVTLGATPLPGVSAITVDRRAERTTIEWSDMGPHAVFADIPEQRTTIRIARAAGPADPPAPKPGDTATLTFRTGPSRASSGAVAVSATVVILAIAHTTDHTRGTTQTIECLALSTTGAADPITETPIV